MTPASDLASDPTLSGLSQRRHTRSNTFLMANVVSDSLSAPVRIKNISATGALLTGAELPRLGETCRLRRADISVTGHIVRVTPGTAAIHFAREIDIARWIGSTHQLQQDVDRVVQDAKHRYPVADSNHRVTAVRQGHGQLAPSPVGRDDLLDLADQIDRLANAMSDDIDVITRYGTRLQVLDIASQRLRAACR